MFGSVGGLLLTLINIFILVLIVRAIFSWFPGMLYSQAGRIIVMATEWYLAPIRRVIPPAGGLDISFLVGIIILYALAIFIGSGDIVRALSRHRRLRADFHHHPAPGPCVLRLLSDGSVAPHHADGDAEYRAVCPPVSGMVSATAWAVRLGAGGRLRGRARRLRGRLEPGPARARLG